MSDDPGGVPGGGVPGGGVPGGGVPGGGVPGGGVPGGGVPGGGVPGGGVPGGGVRAVLVRHGETEWSLSGRHTGRTDIALTVAGRHEAALTGRRLAGTPFSLVLMSPLGRAIETCRLAGLATEAVVDPDLAEWDYGAYEGKTTEDIRARRPAWDLWRDGCPDGEMPADVAGRADRVIARCRRARGDVAVFAHGHLLRVLGARWVGRHASFGSSLLLDPASVSVLGAERDTPALALWNDTGHLRT